MKKYGTKKRTLFNRETGTIINIYSPIIYNKNGIEVFISEGDEIMEFLNRKDAFSQAKETYNKLKEKKKDWIR